MLLAETSIQSLDIAAILMGLLGGLALFLFGMEQMSDALKLAAGNGMKRLLSKLTTNRFTGAIAGSLVTSVAGAVVLLLIVGLIEIRLPSSLSTETTVTKVSDRTSICGHSA